MLRTAAILALTLLLPGATAGSSPQVTAAPHVTTARSSSHVTTAPHVTIAPLVAPASATTEHWVWPTDAPRGILRPFIAPASRYGAGHRGIDMAAGTSAIAPAAGIVHFAGVVVDRPLMSIEHPGGVLTSYEPVVSALHAGDSVTAGQMLGAVQPGHCTQTCLHFGVRINGEYVSPMNYFGGIPPAVLLPLR
ncbi:M23 family metallopeptidase [Glaciihabitans sp. dw_435]|uniref:M23 family metallopeptidase n=1 Tax=Glaciihabitans sp. dw_435 TaxID=2720081 RepID=UPI001BD1C6CD|nr:M23 family metallopeptidase [Glaciihabitans sp. dw_435]